MPHLAIQHQSISSHAINFSLALRVRPRHASTNFSPFIYFSLKLCSNGLKSVKPNNHYVDPCVHVLSHFFDFFSQLLFNFVFILMSHENNLLIKCWPLRFLYQNWSLTNVTFLDRSCPSLLESSSCVYDTQCAQMLLQWLILFYTASAIFTTAKSLNGMGFYI